MKIDLLITELFTGGAERCCAELARYLHEHGHSVRVISIAPAPTTRVDSLLYEHLNDHKIPTVLLNASKSYHLPRARSKIFQQIRNHPTVPAQSFPRNSHLLATSFSPKKQHPRNIQGNGLSPGCFQPNRIRGRWVHKNGTYTERGAAICGHTPRDRFGEGHELAGAVVWLASHAASSFVTGQNIVVDGGFSSTTI